MAREYRIGLVRKLVNRVVAFGARRGWGKHNWLLTTRGRRTGELRTTPVTPMHVGGEHYLVSPYGEVGWVHNARAAGRVTLRHGAISDHHHVTEMEPDDAAPVLKAYLEKLPVVRPFFDVTSDSSLEDIAAEAPRHPVFRLEPIA